jgi:hypothetical protein
MPIWPFKKPDPATEALRRIEKVRKSGARKLFLSDLELSRLPEAIDQLSQLQMLQPIWLFKIGHCLILERVRRVHVLKY